MHEILKHLFFFGQSSCHLGDLGKPPLGQNIIWSEEVHHHRKRLWKESEHRSPHGLAAKTLLSVHCQNQQNH